MYIRKITDCINLTVYKRISKSIEKRFEYNVLH